MKNVEKEFLSKKNVIAVGRSKKRENGEKTGIDALTAFVTSKDSEEELDSEDIIPKFVGNDPTDVVEIGSVKAENFNMTDKMRPYPQGSSIGHQNVSAGTAGRIMYKSQKYIVDGEEKIYPVPVQYSNNHVLTDESSISDGDVILQPGKADGSEKKDEYIVGTKIDYIDLDLNDSNLVDGAWFEIDNFSVASSWHPESGVSTDTDTVAEGDIVHKLNTRTSDGAEGEVLSDSVVIDVEFPQGVITFEDQILVDSISKPGDSGSTVYKKQNKKDVGTLFAGSNEVTVVNKIDNILDQTGLCLDPENVYK